MSYAQLLKHPNWQKKRLEILNDRGFACERCEEKEKTLHIHHLIYKKGCLPWEYESNELSVLCEDCHKRETDFEKLFLEALNELKIWDGAVGGDLKERLYGYILGLISLCFPIPFPPLNQNSLEGLADSLKYKYAPDLFIFEDKSFSSEELRDLVEGKK